MKKMVPTSYLKKENTLCKTKIMNSAPPHITIKFFVFSLNISAYIHFSLTIWECITLQKISGIGVSMKCINFAMFRDFERPGDVCGHVGTSPSSGNYKLDQQNPTSLADSAPLCQWRISGDSSNMIIFTIWSILRLITYSGLFIQRFTQIIFFMQRHWKIISDLGGLGS
jgi:hypothetical protein